MKKYFSTYIITTIILLVNIFFSSCRKGPIDNTGAIDTVVMPTKQDTTITSIARFHTIYGIPYEHFSINNITGATVKTKNGFLLTIPPYAFVTQAGSSINGNVDIEFRDIFLKSDMVLSDVQTAINGFPMKSGGEFFLRASTGGMVVMLANNANIKIVQPSFGFAIDPMMEPFLGAIQSYTQAINPTIKVNGFTWFRDSTRSTLVDTATGYIFNLYQFNSPVDSGTWCNSDNASYFSPFPQTSLAIHANDDVDVYQTEVFLVFTTVNAMVHVYRGSGNDFPYSYAPTGLPCVVVALGTKDGKLYSSFSPITINTNQTVNFSLSLTNAKAFKAALVKLN